MANKHLAVLPYWEIEDLPKDFLEKYLDPVRISIGRIEDKIKILIGDPDKGGKARELRSKSYQYADRRRVFNGLQHNFELKDTDFLTFDEYLKLKNPDDLLKQYFSDIINKRHRIDFHVWIKNK